MSQASILNKLSDADLEEIRHLIRRDAETDLEIAKRVESKLKRPLGKSDAAKIEVIYRYRKGKPYLAWLKRWESEGLELRKHVAETRGRLELLKDLVGSGDQRGLERVSKGLLGRLLVLAADTRDKDLPDNLPFVRNVIRLIQQQQRLDMQSIAERAANVAGDRSLNAEQRAARVREIFSAPKA